MSEKVVNSLTLETSYEETGQNKNYFGENARASFFERFRWLNHQTDISLSNRYQPLDASYINASTDKTEEGPELVLPPIWDSDEFNSNGNYNNNNRNQGFRGFLTEVESDWEEGVSLSSVSKHSPPSRQNNPSRNNNSIYNNYNNNYSNNNNNNNANSSLLSTPAPTASGGKRKVFKFSPDDISHSGGGSQKNPNHYNPKSLSTRSSLPSLATIGRMIQNDNRSLASRRSLGGGGSSVLPRSPLGGEREGGALLSSASLDSPSSEAFLQFFTRGESNNDFTTHMDDNGDDIQLISPRTKFLASCIKEKLNPRASLLLRKNHTSKLSLQHQGMNDTMARSFAKSLQSLPGLESLNIADNRLSDPGLTPILAAVSEIGAALKELNLSQNKIGPLAAKALKSYLGSENCALEKLVLSENKINDTDCRKIIESLIQRRQFCQLRELDLSRNEIGKLEKVYNNNNNNNSNGGKPASSSSSTGVKTTIGNGNDIISPIGSNITGSHAIANLLRSSDCRLTRLNLQWNLIRLDGAINLCRSLAINKTLVWLDISYNALSRDGAMAMGTSLIHNSTLEYLNLAYNSIDSVGALTLAMGIIENKSSLKKVVLDGNPIGATGAKALLLVPILSETEVELSLDKCNATIKDVKGCWFSFDKIVNNDFELNMENGFDRAVCIFLFNILAGHPSYKISKLTYDSSNRKENKGGGGGGAGRPIALVPFLSPRSISAFTTKQNALLSALDRVLVTASNYQQAMDWFTEIDENGSGNLDLQEFTVLMNKIGMDHLGEKRMAQLFKKYDITNEGTIDLTGFLLLLRQQQMESQERKNEMMFRPLLREKQANENETNGNTTGMLGEGNNNNNNNNNNEKLNYYLPPETGIVRITIIDDPLDRKSEENSKYLRIFTSSQCESVIRLVHQMNSSSNHLIDLLSSLLDFARVRYYEAIAFADVMLLETSDKIEVSQKILLSISNSADTAHFLHAIFGDNRQEVMRFKWECGFIIKPLLGSPNGFYSLDLAKELHRKCFFKLLQINAQLAEKRMKFFSGYNSNNENNSSSSHLGDISQKLNFSCFRNEMYNGAPYTIGNQFTTSSNSSSSATPTTTTTSTTATTGGGVPVVNGVPSSGKIEFDFSTSQRPPKDALPIADKKLLKVLLKHSLLSILDVGVALWKLEEKKERNQLSLACKGTELVENNPERAGNINNHMNDFYSHLEIRSQQLQENRERICRPNTTTSNNSNNGSFKGVFSSSPEEEKEKYSCPKTIRETVLDEISRVEDFFNRRKSKLTGGNGGGGYCSNTKEARELEKFLSEQENSSNNKSAGAFQNNNSSSLLSSAALNFLCADPSASMKLNNNTITPFSPSGGRKSSLSTLISAGTGTGTGFGNNNQSRRNSTNNNNSSPWKQISFKDIKSVEEQRSDSDSDEEGGGNGGKGVEEEFNIFEQLPKK
jgi:hypothetical protein